MSLPSSLHGNEYLEHLRRFRDSAFVESHWIGRRRSIGGFAFGVAQTQWVTEEGGVAHLIEEGLRYKGTALTRLMSTTLRLIHSPGEKGMEMVTFRMDIDDIGYIDVYRNLIIDGSFREIISAELHKRADRRHGLSVPTDEQRELLYTEMQRGASGLYPIAYDHERR